MSLGERFRGNLGTKVPMRWPVDSDFQCQRKPWGWERAREAMVRRSSVGRDMNGKDGVEAGGWLGRRVRQLVTGDMVTFALRKVEIEGFFCVG